MRQFRFDYSLEDIPIPPTNDYLQEFDGESRKRLKRIIWIAHFFLKDDKSKEKNPVISVFHAIAKHFPPF